jgi:type I restriction enzyme S subunit
MLEGLKPYDAYQSSGTEHLGEFPAHWRVRRAKVYLREVDERSVSGAEELLSVSHKTGVTPRREKNVTMFLAESNVGHKVCRPGDVVVNTMWAWMAAVGASNHTGLVSPSYGVYRPRSSGQLDIRLLDELLRTPKYRDEYVVRSTGVTSSRLRLYPDQFLKIPLPVPPPDEQAAIVRFLDHADRRIRRYIRAKQQLIKLLEEQKQAIIHQAVTRGLDPSVPVRATASTWFPEIPAHWQVVAMSRVVPRAVDGPHHSPQYVDNGIPFLSARNVKADRWSLDNARYISASDYEEFSRRVVPKVGDVLYTKGGTTGVARAVDLPFPFQVWVHIAVLKLRRDMIDPFFLASMLNSPRCYEQSQLFTRGATNQDLGLGRMRQIEIALPPLEEQRQITEMVRDATAHIVNAVETASREISLLRELRTRLIADVVTGQLDVRAAAAALPEEPEGDKPLDVADEPGDDDLDAAPEDDDV